MVRKAAALIYDIEKLNRQTNEKEKRYEDRVGSCDIGCVDMDIDTQYKYPFEGDKV